MDYLGQMTDCSMKAPVQALSLGRKATRRQPLRPKPGQSGIAMFSQMVLLLAVFAA
jgi:hypothetical protein